MHRVLSSLVLCAALCPAQTPKVSSNDESVIFKSRVDLAVVPVVVRDETGKPADNLRADEFQLLDRGKPQTISKFSIERSGGTAITRTPAAGETPGLFNEAPALIAPDHFVGLLFDDIHANFGELSIHAHRGPEVHRLGPETRRPCRHLHHVRRNESGVYG